MLPLQFTLPDNTIQAEFKLLKEMYDVYITNPWAFVNVQVNTPDGLFVNTHGGANGCPSDLWLVKAGTKGRTRKTFWRTSFGSKKSGFSVFALDMRSMDIRQEDMPIIAKTLGAKTKGLHFIL